MQPISKQQTAAPYHQYLAKKFKWQPCIIDTIKWRIIKLTSRRFALPDQTWIQKLTHEWLPTRISLGNSHTNKQDKLCPLCRRSNETTNYLLMCNHPNRQQIYNELHQQLTQICMKNQINPNFCQLLWLGLQLVCSLTPSILPKNIQLLSNQFTKANNKLDGINYTMANSLPNG